MKRKRKAWAKSFGSYGNKIRIFEDPTSKILYAEIRDPSLPCGYRARSLRHKDKKRARRWAAEQVAKLASGDDALRDPTPRVARVIGLYLTHKTPLKVKSEQTADQRRAKMFTRVLGADMDLSKLSAFLRIRSHRSWPVR